MEEIRDRDLASRIVESTGLRVFGDREVQPQGWRMRARVISCRSQVGREPIGCPLTENQRLDAHVECQEQINEKAVMRSGNKASACLQFW